MPVAPLSDFSNLNSALRHYGSQRGRVQLADRKVRVKRPRLRHKTEGEVPIPAYEALRKNQALSQYMLGALMRGIFDARILRSVAEDGGTRWRVAQRRQPAGHGGQHRAAQAVAGTALG
jgi:hypothetical protein